MKILYDVVALHPILVDTAGDGVTFSKEQLLSYGRSLSDRPLSINHAALPHDVFRKNPFAKVLPYPENKTLNFKYDSQHDGLLGQIQLADTAADVYIRMGLVKHLSVEHLTYRDGIICFTGLALLTQELPPRDPATRIIRESRRVI